jgi:uncharacterized protein YgiM (DUF1202 family)
VGNTALDLDLISQAATSRRLVKKKLNRRTIIKAAAAFSAMSAAHSTRRTAAQSQGVPTLAAEWVQPDGLGGTGDSLGFEADFPFHAIAPHWPGETDYSAAVEMQVSGDGETWSLPVVVGPAHTDAGPADRDNRIFGQLAFTEESRYVRYRPLDANGNMQSLPSLSFTYIDATGGPGLGDISTESPVPSLDRPPIISREEWGANLAYGGVEGGAKEWIPEFQTVEHVIIHHSETANFRDPLAEIRSIHYYHAVTRGWGDIGYNYLVDFMGNVYEGRVGGDNVVGGHAYQYAYGSAGICTIGSFSMSASTPEALAGLIWITAWSSRYLDPLGRADFHEKPNLPTICGHRDVNDSSCPGDGLYADLGFIREAVAEVLAGTRETIPDPAYSPGQIVETVSDGVNLRQLPGTGEPIIRELPYGSVFQVIDGPTTVDDHVWYQLEGEAGFGWVAASNFGPSNAAPPAGKFKIGEELVIDTDGLNIRETPSLKGLISATLPYMAKAVVASGPMPANGYKWYQVTTDYGAGWSVEHYLEREGQVMPPTRFIVGDAVQVGDPEGIRLRSAPSSESTAIASLSPGVPGAVTEGPTAADGYVWLKIQTPQGTGWCAEEFLDEAPSADPPVARFGLGDRVLVDTDSLNLRESPGATAPIVVSLGTGMSAKVLGGPETANNMNWYQLETDYGTGWSVEPFLAREEAASAGRVFSPGDRVYVNTDALNLRSSPGIDGEVAVVLVTNDGGEIADGPVEKDGFNWYRVRSEAGTGWGAAQYLGKGTADPFSDKNFSVGDPVYVDTDLLNIRAKASLSGAIVTTLGTDESATVSNGPVEADGFGWVSVTSPKGAGWCVVDYLAKESGYGPRAGDTARVFDGELNLRAATSVGSDVIAVIPDAAYVEVLEGPVGAESYDWYRVSTSRFGTGWCAGQWLTVV